MRDRIRSNDGERRKRVPLTRSCCCVVLGVFVGVFFFGGGGDGMFGFIVFVELVCRCPWSFPFGWLLVLLL